MVTKDDKITMNFHISFSYLYLQLTSTTSFNALYTLIFHVNISFANGTKIGHLLSAVHCPMFLYFLMTLCYGAESNLHH